MKADLLPNNPNPPPPSPSKSIVHGVPVPYLKLKLGPCMFFYDSKQ